MRHHSYRWPSLMDYSVELENLEWPLAMVSMPLAVNEQNKKKEIDYLK